MVRLWITGEAGAGHWEDAAADSTAARLAAVALDDRSDTVTLQTRPGQAVVIDNSDAARAARMAARTARKLNPDLNTTLGSVDAFDSSKTPPVLPQDLGSTKILPGVVQPGKNIFIWGPGGVPPKPPVGAGTGAGKTPLSHSFDVSRGALTRTIGYGIGVGVVVPLLGGRADFIGGMPQYAPTVTPAKSSQNLQALPGPSTDTYSTPSPFVLPSPSGDDDMETMGSIYFDEISSRRRAKVWTKQNVRAALALREFGRAGLAIVAPRISSRRLAVVGAMLGDPEGSQILANPDIMSIVPSQFRARRRRNFGRATGFRRPTSGGRGAIDAAFHRGVTSGRRALPPPH